jgi:hypothetical protein
MEEKIKEIIEKYSRNAIGEWGKNMEFMIDVFSEVWDEAQKEVYKELLNTPFIDFDDVFITINNKLKELK